MLGRGFFSLSILKFRRSSVLKRSSQAAGLKIATNKNGNSPAADRANKVSIWPATEKEFSDNFIQNVQISHTENGINRYTKVETLVKNGSQSGGRFRISVRPRVILTGRSLESRVESRAPSRRRLKKTQK